MARKKGSVNKRKKQQSFKMDSNVQVVLLILVGIVTAISIYNKSSYMGGLLNDIFGGMFYIEEEKRGFEPEENHAVPGRYEIEIEPGKEKQISFVLNLGLVVLIQQIMMEIFQKNVN